MKSSKKSQLFISGVTVSCDSVERFLHLASCQESQPSALSANLLPKDIQQHLHFCPDCTLELEALRECEDTSLFGECRNGPLISSPLSPSSDELFTRAVMARVRDEQIPVRREYSRWRVRVSAGAAAVIVMSVIGIWISSPTGQHLEKPLLGGGFVSAKVVSNNLQDNQRKLEFEPAMMGDRISRDGNEAALAPTASGDAEGVIGISIARLLLSGVEATWHDARSFELEPSLCYEANLQDDISAQAAQAQTTSAQATSELDSWQPRSESLRSMDSFEESMDLFGSSEPPFLMSPAENMRGELSPFIPVNKLTPVDSPGAVDSRRVTF